MRPKRSIEEMEAALQELEVFTEYIDLANDLSFELIYNGRDGERAYVLAKEVIDLCTGRFAAYRKGLVEALINLAFYEADQSHLQEALRLILQAGTIAAELGDTKVSFKQFKIQRFIYALMDDYANAISASFERMTLAQKVGNPHEEVAALEALVYDCYRVKEYSRALAYSEKAFILAKQLDDDATRAHIHMYHTYPLRKLGQLDLALHHALEAYSFYKGQTSRDETFSLSILGYIYLEMEDYGKAIATFQQERAILEKLDNHYLLAYNDCTTGMAHLAAGRVEEAIRCLESGIKWAESQESKTFLLENYPYLVQAYKANQNYEQALVVFEKLANIREELNNLKAMNQRNTLLVIHETEQAQLEAKYQKERADILREQADTLAQQNALIQKIDAIKNELVATASHDLRSPLTAIGMDLFLLQRMTQGIPNTQRYIDRLLKNVEHLTHLIEDLLDFSNIQETARLERERCDLTNLVQEAVLRHQALARAKTIDLAEALPDHPIQLSLDIHQFKRVLDNLISNAIKYTGDGGKVTVSLEADDGHVRLSVRDSGRGIPADEIPHVFDSRFRASNSHDQRGEGHGLSIVKSIVDSHHGTIICRSILGEGTTFTISLP